MLVYAILELLQHKPLSGYELKKRFSGSIVFFWHARHSQVYPELKRMEKQGLIAGTRVEQETRPAKRVYAITADGERALKAWLKRPVALQAVKDQMMLKTFAFHLIEPQEAAAQLRHHQRLHQRRLDLYLATRQELEQRCGEIDATGDPIAFWNAVTLGYSIELERSYIAWCNWALERQRRFNARAVEANANGAPAGGPTEGAVG